MKIFFKVCSKCQEEKDIEFFEFRSDTKKYRNQCKKCNKNYTITLQEKKKIIDSLLENNLKEYSKCFSIKNINLFNNDKTTYTGKTSNCKSCISKKYTKEENRKFAYKTRYGIELEEYNQRYSNQEGKCKICDTSLDQLVVDHCHLNGHVRGLLCGHCNTGLGFFKDNINNLLQAIKYLKQ